ncbi:MAG: hypothetical protein ACKO2V_02835 [Snowella sp.]
MTTYSEILNQIETLNPSEQSRLFEELKQKFDFSLDINEFFDQDLADSESEWQNYIEGNDSGKSIQEIELELFGEKI